MVCGLASLFAGWEVGGAGCECCFGGWRLGREAGR